MSLTTDAELSRPPQGALRPEDAALIGAPNVVAPVTPSGMAAPNVLVPIAPGGAPYPLNHARIGYESGIQSAALTASSGSATVAALNTVSTWERWAPEAGGTQTVTATFAGARSIDYVGLASYDLAGATVAVQYSPDLVSGFTTLVTVLPGADGALMRLFNAVSARRVRLSITRTAAVSLGVWFMGSRLDLERPFYGGFKPPTLNRQTAYDNEISTAGQMLGRNINSQGIAAAVSLNNLSSDWYRTYFDPFVQHARRKPFFMLWNPQLYPDECIYGATKDDIAPTNIGGRLKVSVSFDMEGYA
jgi:hypothetical protein